MSISPHGSNYASPSPSIKASYSCQICCDLELSAFKRSKFYDKTSRSFDYSDMVRSSAEGCEACGVLQLGILNVRKHSLPWKVELQVKPNSSLVVELRYPKERKETYIEFYTEQGKPSKWELIGPARSISLHSSSSQCMQLARYWIQDCAEFHPTCSYKATEMPSRVIHVGSDSQDPRLHISNGQVGKYTALSHCWGTKKSIQTTSSNFKDMIMSIPFNSLPKTFQDAIQITRKLGIVYLWIDSLCILQDSTDDWEQESSKMSAVYASAVVTIAADRAADDTEGCFGQPHTNVATVFRMSETGADGQPIFIYVRRKGWCSTAYGEIAHRDWDPLRTTSYSKLDTRAWAFQERLLSPRILHFTETEVAMECVMQLSCECQIQPRPLNPKKDLTWHNSKISYFDFDPYKGDWNTSVATRKYDWGKVVMEYTSRLMTFDTDRLPALSGVAKLMTDGTGEGYVAGMWKNDLQNLLLWSVSFYGLSETRKSERFTTFYAPSWSWASVTGPVKFPTEDRHFKERITDLKIASVDWLPATSNPYGRLKSASLQVNGYLAPVTVTEVRLNETVPFRYNVEVVSKHATGDPLWPRDTYTPDVQDTHCDVAVGDDLFLLLVAHVFGFPHFPRSFDFSKKEVNPMIFDIQGPPQEPEIYCLVLKKAAGRADVYERVGLMGGSGHYTFDEWRAVSTRDTLTII